VTFVDDEFAFIAFNGNKKRSVLWQANTGAYFWYK